MDDEQVDLEREAERLKTILEVQRAHDILLAVLLGEINARPKTEQDQLAMSAAANVLCWVLGDDCGSAEQFTANLAAIDAAAAAQGYTLNGPISTYRIEQRGAAITCLRCGSTSLHPDDVDNRYCAKCGIFHDDIPREHRAEWVKGK